MTAQASDLHGPVLRWYAAHARDLPWRRTGTTPWGVLVSEVMLQQTPVSRVVPAWTAWLHRWPHPAALADQPPGEAVRAWGGLGYPRRALRLHRAAVEISARHDGAVPHDVTALRALPGVGDYTAAAVAAFAFGQRQVVLDVNVRRVHARLLRGAQTPAGSPTVAERSTAHDMLPAGDAEAAAWAVAVMELGAVVCTARKPRCGECPVAAACAWRAAGRSLSPSIRRSQPWEGTDRQCRGVLLGAVRESTVPVARTTFAGLWPEARERYLGQREACLASLVRDGLLVDDGEQVALPVR